MRARTVLVLLLAFPACATLSSGSSSSGKFPGGEAVKSRIKELEQKSQVAIGCMKGVTETPSATIEVTAASDGKMASRTLLWSGPQTVEPCILDAARMATVPPLAGAPVSAIWELRPKDAPPAPPPDVTKLDTGAFQPMQARVQQNVDSCAQRHLSEGFGADIELTFVILPGGRTAAVNVMESTAADTDFDVCVQNAVGGTQFPDTHYLGAFPYKLRFHVGPSSQL